MAMTRGIIALDIDGTLTDDPFTLSEPVQRALQYYHDTGWTLIFLTGRPFGWGSRPLLSLSFPYHIAAINGADLVAMPECKLVLSRTIEVSTTAPMDEVCRSEESDYVLYGGFAAADKCYYRPSRFSTSLHSYLEERCRSLGEEWIAVDSFSEIPISAVASVKSFGDGDSCYRIVEKMEGLLGWKVTVIRDPFRHDHYVAQATTSSCDKGAVLRAFKIRERCDGPVIVAGDDFNDVSMLQIADIKIVMATAPEPLLAIADIIAAPAAEDGIIAALETACNIS